MYIIVSNNHLIMIETLKYVFKLLTIQFLKQDFTCDGTFTSS